MDRSREHKPWTGAGLIASGISLLAMAWMIFFLSPLAGRPAVAAPAIQTTPDGQAIFQQKCTGCHTIGKGKLVGPDLQGVLTRRDPAWVKGFITAPDQVLASGDKIATDLLKQYNNVAMPNLGLKPAEVDALLVYLENPGAAPQVAAQVVMTGTIAAGNNLFNGTTALAGASPNCIACHTVAGQGALGGGSLGPDLTHVFQRYGGPGLQSALLTLPFPTMQGVFLNKPLTAQEQADLFAYFEWADKNAPVPNPNRNLALVFGIGSAGAAALFLGMVFYYPRQRESLAERLRRNALGKK